MDKMIVNKNRRVKKSVSEVVCLTIFFCIILLWCLSYIYTFFWTIINSLKTVPEFYENTYNFPAKPIWQNYPDAFTKITLKGTPIYEMAWNTIWMAFLGSFVNIAASTLVAYSISKFRFPGRNFVYALAIFVQVVPIIGSGSASYKLHANWGLLNNPYLIWMGWANGFDFAFLVLYGYFNSVSDFYSEAAEIDGASNIRILFQVNLPQAMPAILSLTLLQLVGMWNNYNISMIYMKAYPSLAYGLYEFQQQGNFAGTGDPVYLAAVLMSMLPVLTVYACFQKTIMTNVSVGGIKG